MALLRRSRLIRSRIDLAGDLPPLTGLRAVAAMWVLLYHAWVEAGPRAIELGYGEYVVAVHPVLSLGWAGVDIFFVLSSFLLTLPFALAAERGAARPSLRRYFLRRGLRILPAYYLQLAIVVLLAGFASGTWPATGTLLAHLVLALNIGPDPVAPLVGVWWTLPIEFAFYLVLPLLLPWLTPRRVLPLLFGAVALTVAYRWHAFEATRALDIGYRVVALEQLPGRIDQFVVGMVAAWLVVRADAAGRAPSIRAGRTILALGLAGAVACALALAAVQADYWEGHPLLFAWHATFSLPVACLVVGAIYGGRVPAALLANRAMVFLGTISYGIYLWHQELIRELHRLVFDARGGELFVPLAVLGLAAAVVVASASYFVLERPLLRIGNARRAGQSE